MAEHMTSNAPPGLNAAGGAIDPAMGTVDTRELTTVMKALSDPNRVRILKLLQDRELCVCELRAALELAQPTVSKHLKVLEQAGLVTSRKDKMWVNYSLHTETRDACARTMLALVEQWLEQDREMNDLRFRLRSIHREDICGS